MIDINELRIVLARHGTSVLNEDEVLELLDRLESAESDALEQARLSGMGSEREAALMAKLEAAEKTKSDWLRANAPGGWIDDLRTERDELRDSLALESQENGALRDSVDRACEERDALRAEVRTWKQQSESYWEKIEAMEQQEPSAWCATDENGTVIEALGMNQSSRFDTALYLAPGAQPAPSIPEGWLRAIDEALVVAHIGVANESDAYEQAKAKLDNLIGFHVDVATDPAVNGGWKLVPIEPTQEMKTAGIGAEVYQASPPSTDSLTWEEAAAIYAAMISAAPGAKP